MENVQFEKRSTPIITAKKWLPSEEHTGIFAGTRIRPIMDKTTGEIKDVTDYLLKNPKDGSMFALAGNAGLKNAFLDARVQEGELIKVKKLNKTELDGGRTVNNYEIMVAKKH